jgi:electron transfer flavoprotein beta subunit
VNICVCMKQVPGTTEVKIDPETNTLIRQGIENIINPFDTYAVEEGVRLKERQGGKVTIISMGPPQAEAALRETISLGADEAVLVSDAAFAGADTWATAFTLAKAIEKTGDCDLVICGRQTIDGDTGQVGPEMAEMLDIPFVAYVSQVENISDHAILLRRMVEEGHEIIETELPAVITVTKEINIPRLPSLRGIAKAKSAEIPTWGIEELGIDRNMAGRAGSSTEVIKVFFPQRTCVAEMLEGDVETQASMLIDRLKVAGVL